jgi:hypothetical protein
MANIRLKNILFPLITLAIGCLFLFLVLEIFFRFLPVNEGLASRPVNEVSPVLRFQSDRTATWSKGWNFSIVNRIHTNNYGFVSDYDYEPDAGTPLLAIIGDSYVEAVMVPFDETITGRLASRVEGLGRVYAFASSGSPLSQYLVYAEFVRDTFRPDGMVVVVVGNDFDESLLSSGSPDGYHYFQDDGSGALQLVRRDLSYGAVRRLVRRSDFLMYALLNLELPALPARLGQAGGDYAGNTRRAASPQRVTASERVMEEFLNRLPVAAGLSPENILLVLDGVRPDLYDPAARDAATKSYWGVMRGGLLERAGAAGFQVLDMGPVFRIRYDLDGRRFESPSDAHWNGYAHGLVADAVAESPVWSRVFRGEGSD